MALKNTSEKFGSLTKTLHWIIFMLFIIQYYLVYRREYFPKEAPEKLQYILLHKSLGLLLLLLAFFMLCSRYLGTRPSMPRNMTSQQIQLAKITHFLLYVAMFLQPLTGILMSLLGGYKVSFFGLYDLPLIFEKNESLSHFFFTTHVWTSFMIIALVSLHFLAALYHHFIRRDNVLKRMLPSF